MINTPCAHAHIYRCGWRRDGNLSASLIHGSILPMYNTQYIGGELDGRPWLSITSLQSPYHRHRSATALQGCFQLQGYSYTESSPRVHDVHIIAYQQRHDCFFRPLRPAELDTAEAFVRGTCRSGLQSSQYHTSGKGGLRPAHER